MTRVATLLLAVAVLLGSTGPAAGEPGPQWLWPLDPPPAVVNPFVAPLDPYGPGHRGVDLAATVGQPVRAVAAGRVSFAGMVAGRGVLVVDHGRLRTTYEPVLPLVREGHRVAAGAVVGTVTLAGGHCLPATCLHLGARDGDRYVDPMRWLGSGRIRLLPLGSAESDAGVRLLLLLTAETSLPAERALPAGRGQARGWASW